MSSFTVADNEAGHRIDSVLADRYSDHSRSYWSKAINRNYVTLNNKSIKSGYKVNYGDSITIQIPESTREIIEVPVVYEDKNVVVIDKPAGLLVHDAGNFDQEFTVLDFISEKFTGDDGRSGIVHRLDRTTSGVMVVAKNDKVATALQLQFAERSVKKEYLAICSGSVSQPKAVIDLPIERNPKTPNTFRVGVNGKPSSTTYEVIEKHNDLNKVLLKPKSGRTHQLRVHLSYIGLPILGDELYGGRKASRVMLHAYKLTIQLPNGGERTFTTEPPKDFGYE